MLVLSRKTQESIYLGDDICITILATKGGSVRIGIEAPLDVPILRGELYAVRGGFTGELLKSQLTEVAR